MTSNISVKKALSTLSTAPRRILPGRPHSPGVQQWPGVRRGSRGSRGVAIEAMAMAARAIMAPPRADPKCRELSDRDRWPLPCQNWTQNWGHNWRWSSFQR